MGIGTVCLTFDFDAISLWIARKSTTPTPISRGEFGAVAVPRILHLLRERNVQTTWFIPGHTMETYPDVCRLVVDDGHEIALHGYAHEDFTILDEKDEREIFHRSCTVARELTGVAPKGFRAPSWDLSPRTIDIMLDIGLQYDSSLMGNDYSPYYCRRADELHTDRAMIFGEPTPLVEMPVSWSLDDYPHFEYVKSTAGILPGLRDVNSVFNNWLDDIQYMTRDYDQGVAVVTLHPQVIGRGHRLMGLERWVDQLIDMGVEFARMDRVVQSFRDGDFKVTYSPK